MLKNGLTHLKKQQERICNMENMYEMYNIMEQAKIMHKDKKCGKVI